MNIEEYLGYIQNEKELKKNYKKYKPNHEVIKKIDQFLSDHDEELRILAIGAKWCHDCALQVPRMVKIIQSIDNAKIDLEILYGVKVNALHKKGEMIWHKKHSPPEAVDPKFNLTAIPTFFLFIDDKYIGRVVEGPQKFDTLEEDLLYIIKNSI